MEGFYRNLHYMNGVRQLLLSTNSKNFASTKSRKGPVTTKIGIQLDVQCKTFRTDDSVLTDLQWTLSRERRFLRNMTLCVSEHASLTSTMDQSGTGCQVWTEVLGLQDTYKCQ